MSPFFRTSLKRLVMLATIPMAGYLPQAFALSDGAETFIVGNKIHTGKDERVGPTGNGSATVTVALTSNQAFTFYKTATLQPANVMINSISSATGQGSDNGTLFCTSNDGAIGTDLVIENNFQDSGLTYGGHKLLKTNVQGLYFTLNIRNLGSWNSGFTPREVYIGDYTTPLSIVHYDISGGPGCGDAYNTGYKPIGGITSSNDIAFYTDNTFNPADAETITLLNNGGYSYRIYNPNPGAGIISYYLNYNLTASNLKVALPTCSAATVSGNTVNGTTVSLGSYSPNDILNGATPVPFNIELSGCSRVQNIAVKLATTKTGRDPTLLGNTLGSGNAQGVALEIKGLANAVSNDMVLIPNNDTSVYYEYEDEIDTSTGISGTGGTINTTNQSLKFHATMKHDAGQKIISGKYFATGVFSITYP
jgi:Fimbrial protein.